MDKAGNQSPGISLGDLDSDGDLDAFVVNRASGNRADRVWLNNGGTFSDSGQLLGNDQGWKVSLGDLDGDGDLDAFVANSGSNRIWLNEGGVFNDSGQELGDHRSEGVSLGDLDGDGDLDAFVVNYDQSDRVWLNVNGVFISSGQSLGGHHSRGVALGDVDADGDLDAFVVHDEENRLWLNNNGQFSDSGLRLGANYRGGTSLGDLDGDGDLDIVAAGQSGRIWLNQNPPSEISLSVDQLTIAEAGGLATTTATSSTPASSPITISLATSGTATATNDYTVSASEIVITAGATTGSVSITAIDDTLDEPHETVIVSVTGVVGGAEVGTQRVTVTILDDDEPPIPDVTLSVDSTTIPEDAGAATFTVNLSEATTIPVTVDLRVTGTATLTADYTISATQIVVTAGAPSESVTVTAVQDTADEPDETVIVDITSVTGGTELGTQQQTTTIIDDDDPLTFTVTSLVPTSSGFVAELSTDVDSSVLNLYGTSLGDPDAVLTSATSGPIAGSLVVDSSLRRVTFIKTGDPLAADTYTVTLRSAIDGFKDVASNLLDGNGDGTPGDDFVTSFTVAAPVDNAITISIPDFVRGPRQQSKSAC